MTNTDSQKRRKKVSAAVAMLLILCLLGGTFAWNNYNQHKTNDANLGGLFYKATLVEEFDRTQAKAWRASNPTLVKKISVLNSGGMEAQGDKKIYGDIYARIQLKEFMEFNPLTQQYTTERYMLDPEGRFIRFYPGKNYEIRAKKDAWPVVYVLPGEDEAPLPLPDLEDGEASFTGGGEEAAQEYARLIGVKADNGAHEVAQQRIYFTPFRTALVANNQKSIDAWLAHYNKVNETALTVADITIDGAGETLDIDNKLLPSDMVNADKGLDDAELPWYIKTKENDPNGVYGNFMLIDGQIDYAHTRNMLIDENEDGTADFLNEKIPAKANDDQKKAPEGLHDELIDSSVDVDYTLPQVNGECEYTIHRWTGGKDEWKVNGPDQKSYFDYISWSFGDSAILYSEWDGEPCDKWIIDDRETGNDAGWVWWGSALAPLQQTGNLLENLTLKTQPNDRTYYALHADMQAVSFQELYRWEEENDTSGNDKIVEALRKSGIRIISIDLNEKPEDVGKGTSYAFSETVQGSAGASKDVVWSLEGYTGSASRITQDGKLTVDASETVPTLTVRVTSVQDPTKFAEWEVKVVVKPIVSDVSIDPATADIQLAKNGTFTASVNFLSGAAQTKGVSWSLANVAGSRVNVKDGNITVAPVAGNPLKAVITIGLGEDDNVGQTFKVVATTNDLDQNNKPKTAEAIVTILENLEPSVATTRYIPMDKAGDTSDWLEIATVKASGGNRYSLIVRKDIIPSKSTTALLQSTINGWYSGTSTLAADAALRKVAVANTSAQNPGYQPSITVGLSAPVPGKIGLTDEGTGFGLSYAEAALFCSLAREMNNGGGNFVDSSDAAKANYNALGDAQTNNIKLRSTNAASDYPGTCLYHTSHPGTVGRYYLSELPVMPAMWINATEADKAGLFANR